MGWNKGRWLRNPSEDKRNKKKEVPMSDRDLIYDLLIREVESLTRGIKSLREVDKRSEAHPWPDESDVPRGGSSGTTGGPQVKAGP